MKSALGRQLDSLFEHVDAIKTAYEQVQSDLCLLAYHIQTDLKALPVWAENTEQSGFDDNRIKIIEAIRRQTIDDLLSPSETFSFAGAVACTVKTIEILKQLNTSKDHFKSAVTQYRKSEAYQTKKTASKLLEQSGYPGLKTRQVARHLQYIEYHPRRISWSKAKGSSNIVITQEEAAQRLLKIGQGGHITLQLDLIKKMAKDEKLVIQRKIKPYLSANISSFKVGGRCSLQKIESSLPIFFQYDESKKLPIVEYGVKQSLAERSERIDKKLENDVYLSSISAYRYKKGWAKQ